MFDFIAVILFGLALGLAAALLLPFGTQRGCIVTLLLAVAGGAGLGAVLLSSTNHTSPVFATAFFAFCGAVLGILIRFAVSRR